MGAKRISLDEAKRLSEELYPLGPEGIADALGVTLEYCALTGTDGWCVQQKERPPKIRINKSAVKTRQRFTLAHEIAHLILGTAPEVASNTLLPFQAVKKEEREADRLAAELLIPLVHLKSQVGNVLPVDAFTIKRLAKNSKVSPVVAAGRIVVEATALGLVNGALAVFKEDEFQYCWSPSLRNVEEVARKLFKHARECSPIVLRTKPNSAGQITTAVVTGSPDYPVLVLQLLPSKDAEKKTHHERARELDRALFDGDSSFRQQFSGALGVFKSKAEWLDLETAVSQFNAWYSERWSEDRVKRLLSKEGQAYLEHRLSAWTSTE